jgi:hypothetical protein
MKTKKKCWPRWTVTTTVKAGKEKIEAMSEACLESMVPTSMESEAVHEVVSKEAAAVKKRHGDWHLAVRRH